MKTHVWKTSKMKEDSQKLFWDKIQWNIRSQSEKLVRLKLYSESTMQQNKPKIVLKRKKILDDWSFWREKLMYLSFFIKKKVAEAKTLETVQARQKLLVLVDQSTASYWKSTIIQSKEYHWRESEMTIEEAWETAKWCRAKLKLAKITVCWKRQLAKRLPPSKC